MCEILKELATELVSWEWLKIIQAAASIATAAIAYKALAIWKHKSKADKKTDFIDAISDDIHEFINQLGPAVEVYKFIKIGIDAHAHEDKYNKIEGRPVCAAYVERRGSDDSVHLFSKLQGCNPSLVRIRSLVTKGQIYDFSEYEECQDACSILTSQYDKLQAIASLVGQPNWNWQNPEVTETFEKVLSIDPQEIEQQLREQNVKLISFAKNAYAAIYKST